MRLTDTKVRTTKPRQKPYKIADGGGLYLLVQPTGSKLWRLKYRVDGKEKKLAFGRYPEVSLKQARQRREDARELIACGTDPSEARRAAATEQARLNQRNFAALIELYLDKQRTEGRSASTVTKNEWLLNMAAADFGQSPVSEIKAPRILETLKRVEARGTLETANRLRSIIGTVLRYGMALGWLDADPTPGLRGAITRPVKRHRAAITDSKKFGGLLRAIDEFDGQRTTQIALRLLALLYPRPGELRNATWAEFDLDSKLWSISAERMKMRRLHRVPLPKAAVEQLEELKAITGNHEFILPSLRSWRRPMSDNTLNAALRRMGFSKEEMTAHGFRASFSTMANESGLWHPDAIERALAHVDDNEVRKAYNRAEHWGERVQMAEWWAEKLQCMREATS
ncbi:MAG: integrase arm-type DNA-binding domain-containing protein [Pseudomonadota bacterium]